MNCERCRELLPEAIGGELDPRLEREFRRRLAECADCRRELELLSRTASVLKSAWPEEPIPEPLTFGLPGKAGVAGRFGFGWSRPPRLAWLGLAAAACLVVCLGALSFLNARLQIGQGSFTLAFGPEVSAPRHPASGALRRFRRPGRGPCPPPGGPDGGPARGDLGSPAAAGRGRGPVPMDGATLGRPPPGQRRPGLPAEAAAGHAPGDGPQRGADQLGSRSLPPPSGRSGCQIDPAALRGNPRSSK